MPCLRWSATYPAALSDPFRRFWLQFGCIRTEHGAFWAAAQVPQAAI
jgi:hypothetical protein